MIDKIGLSSKQYADPMAATKLTTNMVRYNPPLLILENYPPVVDAQLEKDKILTAELLAREKRHLIIAPVDDFPEIKIGDTAYHSKNYMKKGEKKVNSEYSECTGGLVIDKSQYTTINGRELPFFQLCKAFGISPCSNK